MSIDLFITNQCIYNHETFHGFRWKFIYVENIIFQNNKYVQYMVKEEKRNFIKINSGHIWEKKQMYDTLQFLNVDIWNVC